MSSSATPLTLAGYVFCFSRHFLLLFFRSQCSSAFQLINAINVKFIVKKKKEEEEAEAEENEEQEQVEVGRL